MATEKCVGVCAEMGKFFNELAPGKRLNEVLKELEERIDYFHILSRGEVTCTFCAKRLYRHLEEYGLKPKKSLKYPKRSSCNPERHEPDSKKCAMFRVKFEKWFKKHVGWYRTRRARLLRDMPSGHVLRDAVEHKCLGVEMVGHIMCRHCLGWFTNKIKEVGFEAYAHPHRLGGGLIYLTNNSIKGEEWLVSDLQNFEYEQELEDLSNITFICTNGEKGTKQPRKVLVKRGTTITRRGEIVEGKIIWDLISMEHKQEMNSEQS